MVQIVDNLLNELNEVIEHIFNAYLTSRLMHNYVLAIM